MAKTKQTTLDELKEIEMDKEKSTKLAKEVKVAKGPYESPEGWRWVRLGDVVKSTQYGISKPMNKEGMGVPIIRMNNITNDGRLDLSDIKHISIDEKTLSKYLLEKGDLLFNRTNSRELVGKTTVFDREGEYVFASYIIRVKLNQDIVYPKFVSYFLNSKEGKDVLFNIARPAIQMANINAEELCSIKIPLPFKNGKPDIEEQKRIAAYFDRIAEKQRKLLELYEQTEKELEMMKQAILNKAFRGQL